MLLVFSSVWEPIMISRNATESRVTRLRGGNSERDKKLTKVSSTVETENGGLFGGKDLERCLDQNFF